MLRPAATRCSPRPCRATTAVSRAAFFLDSAALADDVERRMDALGWGTAHIVGNSLGGWVAFELERRGRARTLTGIAPAGGWTRYTPAKFEIVAKFVAGMPVWLLTRALGPRVLRLPCRRRIAYLPVSASAEGLSEADLIDIIDDVSHCPAYYQLLVKSLMLPGLLELAETRTPTHLVICEKDRVLPHAAVHPALHRAPAVEHAGDDARRGWAHPDVRGAGPDRRPDRRLRRPLRHPEKRATVRRSAERLLEVVGDRAEVLLAGLVGLLRARSGGPGPWSSGRPRRCR